MEGIYEKQTWKTPEFKAAGGDETKALQRPGSALDGPPDMSLASAMFGQNRPRDTPSSSLWPPLTSFPITTFRF